MGAEIKRIALKDVYCALHRFAGLGARGLPEDFADLLQTLDEPSALFAVVLEGLLQFRGLSRLGGFGRRSDGLLLGGITHEIKEGLEDFGGTPAATPC